MKITYYFRDPREGNYSIEKIFNAISGAIEDEFQISSFYVDSRRSKFDNIRAAWRCQGDINHITGDVNWLAYGLNPKHTIITVHDIGHYENTLQGLKRAVYRWFWMKGPYNRVRYITTISKFTNSRISHYFPSLKSKILTIHNPLLEKKKRAPHEISERSPRILQVGSMSNKNVESLIDATKGTNFTLVLLRKPSDSLRTALDTLGTSYEFHFDLDDQEVSDLYQSCDLLYFASTYEGFGLPIIEAQALGLPVITSNICSMPEVAGEGACFVDPFNIQQIRDSIVRISQDKKYRMNLVNKGYKNIERFKLPAITEKYLSLYQRVYSN